MIVPVHADVETVDIDKEIISIDEEFTISGTVSDEGEVTVTAIMERPSVEKINRTVKAAGGTFTFIPVNANDFFKTKGIYTINIFTELQQPADGTLIKIKYNNRIATVLPDFELILDPIGNKQVNETEKLSFIASITDSQITDEEFRLENNPNGAIINKDTGVFSWTPTDSQSGKYIFDIIVKADPLEEKETITVTVSNKPITTTLPPTQPAPEPEPEITEPPTDVELGLASFVDSAKDPQGYVDRYNTEATYKEWFDENFSEYDSIYQAVGLKEPLPIPAPFVDITKDPQSYVDRYNTEATYKEWFDENFSEYDSIYQAVGLKEPVVLAPFVDPNLDPQYYVDRYNTEATYKEWFDENFSEYDSIYQAVGLKEPEIIEEEFGECGEGTDLVNGMCAIVDNSKGGGCLIATAAYGSEMAPQVQLLREIRDNQLMNTESGISFMAGFNELYYSFSPHIADMERENPAFKEMIKIGITPLLSSLSVMSHAETESKVVSYGIGVILINLGMYIGIPAIIVIKTRKYIKI